MDNEILDKINKFTRRPLSADEVYVFSVVLCDNDIDRDCERFSDEALGELKEKFVGRTGIFDHQPSTANQTARIFETEVEELPDRLTKTGEPYKRLKAGAYMVRTDENRDLIAEIDGGIKKEVSISCAVVKKVCSVCGSDRSAGGCAHTKGRMYGGKLCHDILSGITDAYEWSFVAVPAQISAGVTKHYASGGVRTFPVAEDLSAADEELRRDVRRLACFVGGREASAAVGLTSKGMGTKQLIALKKSLEKRIAKGTPTVQLSPDEGCSEDNSGFSMK
jgi:hypothetical protein